jgi:hypothetical protein
LKWKEVLLVYSFSLESELLDFYHIFFCVDLSSGRRLYDHRGRLRDDRLRFQGLLYYLLFLQISFDVSSHLLEALEPLYFGFFVVSLLDLLEKLLNRLLYLRFRRHDSLSRSSFNASNLPLLVIKASESLLEHRWPRLLINGRK